jgi:hypothetical protein
VAIFGGVGALFFIKVVLWVFGFTAYGIRKTSLAWEMQRYGYGNTSTFARIQSHAATHNALTGLIITVLGGPFSMAVLYIYRA